MAITQEQREWKNHLMIGFERKYPTLNNDQKHTIDNLLNKHWELCKTKFSSSIARTPAIFVSAGAAAIDLRAFLPGGALAAVVGRFAFMAGSYLATGLITIETFKKHSAIPASNHLAEEHLVNLLRVANNVEELISQLNIINRDIERAIAKDKQAVYLGALGVFAGGVCQSLGLQNPSNLAIRGMLTLPVAGAVSLPLLFDPKGLKGHPTKWQRNLAQRNVAEVDVEDAKSQGLRQRRPHSVARR